MKEISTTLFNRLNASKIILSAKKGEYVKAIIDDGKGNQTAFEKATIGENIVILSGTSEIRKIKITGENEKILHDFLIKLERLNHGRFIRYFDSLQEYIDTCIKSKNIGQYFYKEDRIAAYEYDEPINYELKTFKQTEKDKRMKRNLLSFKSLSDFYASSEKKNLGDCFTKEGFLVAYEYETTAPCVDLNFDFDNVKDITLYECYEETKKNKFNIHVYDRDVHDYYCIKIEKSNLGFSGLCFFNNQSSYQASFSHSEGTLKLSKIINDIGGKVL